MEWYWIVLIIICSLFILGLLIFISCYFISLRKKNNQNKNIKDYHKLIIETMGGINNITDVVVNSSRLTLHLENNSLINQTLLQEMIDKGIGVVKTSKKITLVIGELAENYAESIIEEKKKHN